MKRVFLMLVLAGVLGTACNKDNTPPAEPLDMSQVDDEEMQRIREDKERMRAEIEAREAKQAQWEEDKSIADKKDAELASKLNYIPVTVVDGANMEGCGWLLQMGNGRQLMPESVPLAYRVQGQKLWVKYTKSEQQTACQVGKAIRLIDVQHKKPAGG